MNPFLRNGIITVGRMFPDEWYLKAICLVRLGRPLNLTHPSTYNEKVNWLKLHDRNPLYTQMVDKLAVRSFVAQKIGEQYLPKLYGYWKKFEDIDFVNLPNAFVLKCTHDSGSVIVCKDKSSFDFQQAYKKLTAHLLRNAFYFAREWPYKNVVPQIIAEELLVDGTHPVLPVYKFFCFNGEIKMIQAIHNDKQKDETCDYLDENWTWLDLRQRFPRSASKPQKPGCFEQMQAFAQQLSAGLVHVRVDFYEANSRPYFSEFTFYNNGGILRFTPSKWDTILGKYITLPVH